MEAGAPGRAGLEPGWGGRPALGMTRQCGLPALPRLPAEVRTRPRGLGSPVQAGCAQGCGLGADCVWPGAYRRGPRTSRGNRSGSRRRSAALVGSGGSAGLGGGRRPRLGGSSCSASSFLQPPPRASRLVVSTFVAPGRPRPVSRGKQFSDHQLASASGSPVLGAKRAGETRCGPAPTPIPLFLPAAPGAPELCFGVGSPTACLGPLTRARILELGCERAVRGSAIARFRGTL